MELHEVMLVIHIAAVGTWFGANIIQAVVPGLAARQGVDVAAGWYRVTGQLGKWVYMPAATLIIITGIVMVLEHDDIGFGTRFVTIGFGMIVISVLLGIFVFTPGAETAAVAVESGEQSRIKSATGRIAASGTAETLLLLFTITVMVLRWT